MRLQYIANDEQNFETRPDCSNAKTFVFTHPPVKVINNSQFDATGSKFSLHSSDMCKYLVQTSPMFEYKLMDTVPGKQIKLISFDVCLLPTHGLFVFIKQIIKLHRIV